MSYSSERGARAVSPRHRAMPAGSRSSCVIFRHRSTLPPSFSRNPYEPIHCIVGIPLDAQKERTRKYVVENKSEMRKESDKPKEDRAPSLTLLRVKLAYRPQSAAVNNRLLLLGGCYFAEPSASSSDSSNEKPSCKHVNCGMSELHSLQGWDGHNRYRTRRCT